MIISRKAGDRLVNMLREQVGYVQILCYGHYKFIGVISYCLMRNLLGIVQLTFFLILRFRAGRRY